MTESLQKPVKHHFVPEFYTRQWVQGEVLYEYRLRHRGEVLPRRTSPGGTGYQKFLYENLESEFMSPADDWAARGLQVLLTDNDWTTRDRKLRSGWARFLMTMYLRHPDDIAAYKARIILDWERSGDHKPLDGARINEILRNLMDHGKNGLRLMNMTWWAASMRGARHPLLTSDRPLVSLTEILGERYGMGIVMPISPSTAFIAFNYEEAGKAVGALALDDFVRRLNLAVVAKARRFVFASDTRQTRFIQNHFGTSKAPSLMDRLHEHLDKSFASES